MKLLFVLFFGLFASILGHPSEALDKALSASKLKLEDAMNRLDGLESQEEELRNLAEQALKPSVANRHSAGNEVYFNAYKTGSFSGRGTLTGWSTSIEVNHDNSDFNPGTGVFTGPNLDTRNANYFYCSACMRCAQGSACEVSMRLNTNTRIATMANRDNQSSRFAEMCQAIVYNIPNGNTLSLFEEAGGGSPGNTKFDSSWRYAQFMCFGIRVSQTNQGP